MSKKSNKVESALADWEHIPAFLSNFQRDNPLFALKFACEWETLYSMRSYIQEMLMAAMGSPTWKDDGPEEKSERMFLYERLMEMVECSYLIDMMIDEGKLIYEIKAQRP